MALLLASAGCTLTSGPPVLASPTPGPGTSAAISASSAITTTYAERIEAKIPVSNGDGLTAAGGFVWVKTDDGRVVRVDPATNRVTGEIQVDTAADPSHYCQGIGSWSGMVWACSASDKATSLVEIDPSRMKVARRARVDKVFDQLSLPSAAGTMWVLTENGTSITRINLATATATSHPLGTRCLQVAASANQTVATCPTESALLLLDPNTAAVLARTELPDPRLAVFANGGIWVDTATGLRWLRQDLSAVAAFPSLTAGVSGDLLSADGVIWIRNGTGTITRIDPGGGTMIEEIRPNPSLTPGSLLLAFGSIWTTSSDDGILFRLTPKA